VKRTAYRAAIVGDGLTDQQTTKYGMNSAVRATEALLLALARSEGTFYQGDPPERTGDVYKRLWTGENGRTVVALAHPWSVAP
jgi:hypothetical protein